MKVKKILTRHQVNCIIKHYRIRMGPFTIREDGLIDVNGNVNLCNSGLTKLPLKFGNVYGSFLCHSNKLTSLRGCPTYIAGDFNCYGNQLTTLQYSPKEVGGDYSCNDNHLRDLKGCPSQINGNFNAFLNQISTLKNAVEKIEGNCYLHHNELTSLLGAPKKIGKSFHVTGNLLDDLVGCPEYIGDTLTFDNDVKLYFGNRNCNVKKVIIQVQEAIPESEKTISPIVISHQRFLPMVFKYIRYFPDFYNENGTFDEIYFNDVILEIKEGLK